MIHVASPIPSTNSSVSESQMKEWAVAGMKTILECCKNNKVKKLIVTSSCATIQGGGFKGNKDPHYSELDFAYGKPNQVIDGYMTSKCLQENEII